MEIGRVAEDPVSEREATTFPGNDPRSGDDKDGPAAPLTAAVGGFKLVLGSDRIGLSKKLLDIALRTARVEVISLGGGGLLIPACSSASDASGTIRAYRRVLMAARDQRKQRTKPKKGKPIEIPVPKREDFERMVRRSATRRPSK
jgi:hypothetical protein